MANTATAFLGFVATLAIYLVYAHRAGREGVSQPSGYFLAAGRHSGSEFANAQTSYALQMATVYPFFVMSFYGEWALVAWNTLFFAIAIFVFRASMPRFFKRGHNQALIGGGRSIHGYIALAHNEPRLRLITAWMSIIGFTGLAAMEIVWGTKVLRVLFSQYDHADTVYFFSVLVLAMYLLSYLRVGGQGAIIRTDQLQLVLGYLSIHGLAVYALTSSSVELSDIDAPWVALLIAFMAVPIMLSRWMRIKDDKGLYFRVLNSTVWVSFAVLAVVIVIQAFQTEGSLVRTRLNLENVDDLRIKLIAFAVLPLLFQFVDVSNWQRIVSVASNDAGRAKDLSVIGGLRDYLLEAPHVWLIPIMLGLCAGQLLGVEFGDADPWEGFLSAALSLSGPAGAVFAAVVVAGIGAIFLSTADALMNAVGYSYAADIDQTARRSLDASSGQDLPEGRASAVLQRGKLVMTLSLAVVTVGFVVISWMSLRYGDNADDSGMRLVALFLSFYTPIIAMSPAVVVPGLTGQAASKKTALMAVTLGAASGLVFGLIGFAVGGVYEWIAIIVCAASSWLIYGIGFLFTRADMHHLDTPEPHN